MAGTLAWKVGRSRSTLFHYCNTGMQLWSLLETFSVLETSNCSYQCSFQSTVAKVSNCERDTARQQIAQYKGEVLAPEFVCVPGDSRNVVHLRVEYYYINTSRKSRIAVDSRTLKGDRQWKISSFSQLRVDSFSPKNII